MSRLNLLPRKFNGPCRDAREAIPVDLFLSALPALGFLSGSVLLADLPAVPLRPSAQQASPDLKEFELAEILWSVSVRMNPSGTDPDGLTGRIDLNPPSVVVRDNVVLLQDDEGIRGLNLTSGRAAWPVNDADTGFLIRPSPFPLSLPTDSTGQTPGGVIAEQRWIGVLDRQLIALDLRAEGRLEWALRIDELLADIRAVGRIASSPLISNGNLFISVCDDRKRSHSLVCCTLAGEVLWRSVPRSLPSASGEIPLDQLAAGGKTSADIIWLIAGQQLLSADCRTGALRWEEELPQPALAAQIPATPTASLLRHGEEIHVLARDRLHLFNRADGRLLRADPTLVRKQHLLGADVGTLVVSGGGLMGIDLQTGAVRWELGGEVPELQTDGVGLLQEGLAFWPARSELWQIDVQQGRIVQRIPIQSMTGMRTGSLCLHHDVLLLLTIDRCSAFRVRSRQTP